MDVKSTKICIEAAATVVVLVVSEKLMLNFIALFAVLIIGFGIVFFQKQ